MIASRPIFSRPCGTGRLAQSNPGLASWAKFSRPCGTEFGNRVLTHPLKHPGLPMKYGYSMRFPRTCALVLAGFASSFALGQAPVSQLPDGPNRETVQRICSSCHSVQMFLGRGMTREQWSGVVSNMIGRGAKISDEEFDQVVEYLGKTLPPGKQGGGGPHSCQGRPGAQKEFDRRGRRQTISRSSTRMQRHEVRPCISRNASPVMEHGHAEASAAPTWCGPSVVLHDRYGSTIGPYLAQGHPAGKPVALDAGPDRGLVSFPAPAGRRHVADRTL